MNFHEVYKPDQNLNLAKPNFVNFDEVDEHLKNIKSGSYNNGLIQICDVEKFGSNTLGNWTHLVGKNALPLLVCGWGDFICASYEHEEFYLVLVQENYKISLGNLIKGVFDINLTSADFRQKLLWAEKFESLVNILGPLKYGECFIHKPWLCLATKEDFSNYSKGDVCIFIDLLGQHWQSI